MHSKKYVNDLRTLWICCLCLATLYLWADPIAITVNDPTDNHLNTPDGGQFGATTDLRGAINHTNTSPYNTDGYIINFSPSIATPITLGAMLPILNLVQNSPLTIDGGSGSPIIIDGANTFRGFIANQGFVTLKNLQIQNVTATGGAGGMPGGGGGMGGGAGLLINAANVTLSQVVITSAKANGGIGGNTIGGVSGGGGGGGLGGDGGNCTAIGAQGAGGGGLGGIGGTATAGGGGGGGGINCGGTHLGNGGDTGVMGSIGGGVGGASAGAGVGPIAGGASGGGGGGGTSLGGGGGGGNGGANCPMIGANGGNGGYGGGGGGGGFLFQGGAGGFGGGGGGDGGGNFGTSGGSNGNFGGGGGGCETINLFSNPGGVGGFGGGGGSGGPSGPGGTGGIGGGAGANHAGSGGGGAGFGGAILVNATGTLTILDSFTSSNNATTPGTGFKPGWAAGNDCFFLTGSSITLDPNGNTITIANSIADDSSASFVGVQPGTTGGTASGVSLAIGNLTSAPGIAPGIVSFPSSNNSTYSGPTLVNRGIFALNGTIISPVTVFSGAKLQGTGTINNHVSINSGGMIHAGNSIGTLTLGSLSMQPGAIMQLEIEPQQDNCSKYIANGGANLGGSILNVLLTQNANQYTTFQTYTFLTSPTGIVGNFGIVNAPAGFLSFVSYLNPKATVLYNLPISALSQLFNSLLPSNTKLSHNQKIILKALINLANMPAALSILTDLLFIPIEQLKEDLNSLSPARNAAATYFTNQNAFAMGKISLDRFAEGRLRNYMRSTSKKNSLAAALTIKSENLLAMADPLPATNTPAAFEVLSEEYVTYNQPMRRPAGKARTSAANGENYGFWGTGFGDFLSQDEQNSNPNISDTASGAVIGFDYYGYKNGIFTLTTGYVHNDINEECCAGNGTSNGGILSFFGTGYMGNGYIEGGLLTGYNRFHMQRNIRLDGLFPFYKTAESSFNNWVFMPHFSGGYDWLMDWGVVEPFGSIDWAVSFQESYKEKNGAPLNLKIKHQTPSILRSQLGINFYETWECEKHAFIFQQTASYINKAIFSTKMTAKVILPPSLSLLGSLGTFTLRTYDQTLNLGGVGGEIFYKHKPTGFFVSAVYQGEFGTSYSANDITGTLGVFF